jgi:two-component system nitrogen regulation response regulator NtrX
MALVLVVDDIPTLAEQYAYDLKRIGGFETLISPGGKQALEVISSEPVDCVILDLEMPEVDGFDVLRSLKERGPYPPVIVYTGTGSYERCVQALKLGAYSFIDKAESMERVVLEVKNALERTKLETEVTALKKGLASDSSLIGSSPAMRNLKDQIGRVAPIASPVLIAGESGTGKELVARELHRLGTDPAKPFVAINCAAIPENLIESELFGHERGAFTGAVKMHRGAFELAAGGTLFLDEVGELPLPAQAKLLRVIEECMVTRIGGERQIQVSARVTGATNRDLEAEMEESRFRQDLYFRLNVHTLPVPPLRDRLSDIPELAEHFLRTSCERFGVPQKRLEQGAIHALMRYDWKRNNVRELRNIIERMIISSQGPVIGLEHVPSEIRGNSPQESQPDRPRTFQDLRTDAERQIIASALDRNDWHISRTARELGLSDHASLLKIMRRLNLKRA